MKYSFYEIGTPEILTPGAVFVQSNLELKRLSMHKFTLTRNAVISRDAPGDQIILVLAGHARIQITDQQYLANAHDIFTIRSGSSWNVKNSNDQNFVFFIMESN